MTGSQGSSTDRERVRKGEAERLYEQARALPPEARAAFIEAACGEDAELRTELLSLLVHCEGGEEFFQHLAHAIAPPRFSAGREPSGNPGERSEETGPTLVPLKLEPGRAVGRYLIMEWVGSGGMGTVYRARDTRLQRDVALKFLPGHLSVALHAEERLLVEARAAAALEHPNVCTIHEFGESEEGHPFIAMAFYEGETLKERLRREPLRPVESAAIAVQIARGLGAAHSRGIVHRDVKPGNVMLTADGTVRLLDFGLAKLSDVTLTGPGVTLGTLAYMSPEQAEGELVDRRTDLWSLGVVLYEMLTGTLPFRGGNDLALLLSILHEDPEPVTKRRPDVPAPLPTIVRRLLQKDPDTRYASAAELLAELGLALPLGRVQVPENEPQRVAALRSYGILDSPPEMIYDELIELAARICRTPSAYIKFFDENRVWFKSKVGLPPDLTEMSREATLCNWTLCQSDLVIIPDCAADERTRDHVTVRDWPKVRFYCSMPLINSEGYALGTFCVFDYAPHEMNFEEQETIRTLARQVVTNLELRRLSTRFSQSLVDLERAKHEIDEERARSEAVLYDVLPRQIADELKASGHVQPRYCPLATVMFIDFPDFSRLVRGMEPAQLVRTLDEYFRLFDDIVERHGLEKIKTIGDWYLCAGGVPLESRSHIADGCRAALDMQASIARLNQERVTRGLEPWEVRIGIHAGPVMSGVVGKRRSTYDIWGDAVSLARRVTAAGAAGRITISEPVYQRARHLFDIEPQGGIEASTSGQLAMYLLHRIKP
jgi:adenylate cyclase